MQKSKTVCIFKHTYKLQFTLLFLMVSIPRSPPRGREGETSARGCRGRGGGRRMAPSHRQIAIYQLTLFENRTPLSHPGAREVAVESGGSRGTKPCYLKAANLPRRIRRLGLCPRRRFVCVRHPPQIRQISPNTTLS